MADVVLSDGTAVKEEIKVLVAVGNKIGLSLYDVRQIVNKRKQYLFAQARKALKEQKRVL